MRVIATVVVAGLATAASAQITPIGPFTGDISESFEGFQNYFNNPNFYEDAFGPISIFGSSGTMTSPYSGQGGAIVIYEPVAGATFGLGSYGSAQVADGTKGSGVNTGFPPAPVTIDFDTPVVDFGGYWGAADIFGNQFVPIVFDFYDVSGALIGSVTEQYGDRSDGSLDWHGYHSDVPIASVVYTADYTVNDGLQANFVPAPGAALLLGAAGLVARRRR